ncbi:hypothetical protein WNY59_15995 [Ahrensia kielensis]|uniref:Gluconate 2-dehydrogenase subunit 3 family protein n=1 Tax=Ahrensia kielensis TaxID=76980 RepID=A0ABU9TB42_9HYPH
MQFHLNDKDRQLIDAILDQLIPANPEKAVPAAGKLGVAEFLIEKASSDANINQAVVDVINYTTKLAEDVSPQTVRQLESELPQEFATLLRLTYMGYYSRADIRVVFGLSKEPVQPKGYDVPSEAPELLMQLTAPVLAGGKIYREA